MASLDNGMELFHRLLRYVKPYRTVLAGAIVGMIIVAATETGFAALIKPMLDGSFVEKDPAIIQIMPFLVIAIFVIRGISGFVTDYGMNWVGRNIIRDLRKQMIDRMLLLPAKFYDHTPTGQLTSKLIYDTEQIAHVVTKGTTIMVRDSLTILGLMGWMLYLNWLLSLFLFVVAPVITLLVRYVNKRFRKISINIQNSMGNVVRVTQEVVEGNRTIKIYGGQMYEAQQFAKANEQNRRQNIKLTVTSTSSVQITQFIGAFVFAAVLYVATLDSLLAEGTVGTFMSFITAFMLMFAPMKRLTNVNVMIQKGIAAAQSIFNLIETETEPDNGTNVINKVQGTLTFKNVFFSYTQSNTEVLKNISLQAKAGQTIAIVGKSGSGKSTLINLIPRFYELTAGEILLDGINIQAIKMLALRDNIALVSQDAVLFDDTIANNIAYGALRGKSTKEIIWAADMANAMNFIADLPQGLNTQVGERGVLLSGGQKQRITIARAILKDAPLLILDEATSALDSESEQLVHVALTKLMANRTTIVIAHRLSTIERADMIYVLEQGAITEQGTHQELLAKKGRYTNLYQHQFRST